MNARGMSSLSRAADGRHASSSNQLGGETHAQANASYFRFVRVKRLHCGDPAALAKHEHLRVHQFRDVVESSTTGHIGLADQQEDVEFIYHS